jgi:hypothetical protein
MTSTRVPPPPPPPPPPRRPEFGWEQLEEEEQEEEQHEEEQHQEEEALTQDHGELEEIQGATPPREYLLTVKYPCSPRQMPSSHEESTSTVHRNGRMDTVQIQVYPQMNADVLAQCVTQAVSQSSVMNGRDFPSSLLVVSGRL